MDITSYSLEKVRSGLHSISSDENRNDSPVRLLFSPNCIDDKNFQNVCASYSRIEKNSFRSVILVESRPGEATRKLTMPSIKQIETPFGVVKISDKMRNDFADEDDDFFINDDAFESGRSVRGPLMMIQALLEDYSALLIQMTDENSFIVKELVHALSEITALKNSLVIFCCDLEGATCTELDHIRELVDSGNQSGLMNLLNRGEIQFNGIGTFIAGLLYANRMNFRVEFPRTESDTYISGFGVLQKQPIYG